MPQCIRIHPADDVAVALCPIPAGTRLSLEGRAVQVREDIPQGHKLALAQIAAGENIIKYGYPIGHAASDIPPGAWVHTHNVRTNLSGEVEYTYAPDVRPLSPMPPETFQGYRRADGRAGVRNELWIIPTVGCVNDCAKALAAENQSLVSGSIDGLYAFPHPFGCSQTGADHAQTRRLLAALARHPNAGGVLVLSLGCENLTHEQFAEELGPYDPARVKFLTCQDVEDEIDVEDLIEEEDCCYTLSSQGYIKRMPVDTYRSQRRGGRGINGQNLKEEDYVKNIFVASTHDYVLFFTNTGRVHKKKGYLIPEASRTARGTAIVNVLPLEPDEKVTAMLLTREFREDAYLVMATKNGTVKRLALQAIHTNRKTGIRALTLEEGCLLYTSDAADE